MPRSCRPQRARLSTGPRYAELNLVERSIIFDFYERYAGQAGHESLMMVDQTYVADSGRECRYCPVLGERSREDGL